MKNELVNGTPTYTDLTSLKKYSIRWQNKKNLIVLIFSSTHNLIIGIMVYILILQNSLLIWEFEPEIFYSKSSIQFLNENIILNW